MPQAMRRLPCSHAHVVGFEIHGELREREVAEVATSVSDALAARAEVHLLLICRPGDEAEPERQADAAYLRKRWTQLSQVSRYAVVGAPEYARSMNTVLDAVIPVPPGRFTIDALQQAWTYVGAMPDR